MAYEPVAHVVLIGLMGTGKTTIGSQLAKRYGRRYLDNDDELEIRTGSSAADVEASEGPEALHRLELSVLRACLAATEPGVVSASAWAPMGVDPAELQGHLVVWLDVQPAIAAQRVIGSAHRPLGPDATLLTVQSRLERQALERNPVFSRLANVVVDVSQRSAAQVVQEICRAADLPHR